MAYYDRAGTPGCVHCLVEDLDLMVQEIDDNKIVTGSPVYATSNSNTEDNVNNYEKIEKVIEHGKLYKVSVKARNIVHSTKYS
eukprot:CAMPEP_0197830276 /NCGR_PEP_ID=MMETSP1437-20131217/6875_1 /TAXON_ID=49252 ORGANISM="Eucampia antarctica, Strain CCMP1452" /NCGR_SAMPLE_ID=MMETSP1437 /ASSEMBLY_ACC=CAM_ASM_001096 /LENGTH=82 /DNA_ID=CAMNT_0043432563 /DNA_START=64 /DNA_END=308 /DNA_ORIENTATION=-